MNFYLLSDSKRGVRGVATVSNSFRGFIHKHAEPELYVLLKGSGIVRLGQANLSFQEGDRIIIPSNTPHAFVATSSTPARLYFEFERGPLASIRYVYGFGSMRPKALRIPPFSSPVKKTKVKMFDK